MALVRTLGSGAERPRVVVVGCGGAGGSALHAIPSTAGADVLAINDVPNPSLPGVRRLSLGKAGLRDIASMDPRAVKSLATPAEQTVAVALGDAEFVVPLAGLGGAMGSWAANLVARVARLKGATTLAVVTAPFSAEGPNRRTVAAEALALLRRHARGVVVLPNDPLLRVASHLPLLKAFAAMARLMVQPVHDLLRVLTRDDLPAVRSTLRSADDWQLGIGEGTRDHPELGAVEGALRSPWISRPPEEARGVILLAALPEPDEKVSTEILRYVNLQTPRASVLWGTFSAPNRDAVGVTLLLGF